MSFELVTFEELRNVLKLEKNTVQEYPSLEVLKGSVESAIENFLGRELEEMARTESILLPLDGTMMIQLKGTPVSSVATVTITDAFGNQETLTEQSDFRITSWGIRLFQKHKDVNVSVTYTGGYAEGEVPGIITRAALLQTIHEFRKAPDVGAQVVESEGGTIRYPELGLLKHVKEILHPYVNPLRLGIL